MHKMTDQQIKECEFEILRYFDKKCRENNLSYMLAYGTALGAVRHKGFIPWDDDIDVAMPREDYKKLSELLKNDDGRFQIRGIENDTSYHHYMKLVDSTTLCKESYIRSSESIGVWIDIFPMERLAVKSTSAQKIIKNALRRHKVLNTLMMLSIGDPSAGTSTTMVKIKSFLNPISSKLDAISIGKRINANAEKLGIKLSPKNERPTHWIVVAGSTPIEGCLFPDEMLFPTGTGTFENHVFPIPHDPDGYLTQCYGNWKSIPPIEGRHSHFPSAFQL
ncbi:LicD family protein [Collinsella bouchesdurhonensis]|uniref:LicD family protein n=1 Tax=Collinsella bouchesdurhonensis TaxID=1907654 RepID=UPI003F8B88EF